MMPRKGFGGAFTRPLKAIQCPIQDPLDQHAAMRHVPRTYHRRHNGFLIPPSSVVRLAVPGLMATQALGKIRASVISCLSSQAGYPDSHWSYLSVLEGCKVHSHKFLTTPNGANEGKTVQRK